VTTYESVLEALADGSRRSIMELLRERPHAVGELAEALPISQPAVSQHLKVLKQAGLVIDRPLGARRVYQVSPEGLADLQAYLQAFWAQTLAGLKETAEKDERGGPG
jgi:DNA-binding transcriptional ArsR family regulator